MKERKYQIETLKGNQITTVVPWSGRNRFNVV